MESGGIFNAVMIIGFLGIVWLLIYGNLSGNLGFAQESSSFTNETITLQDAGDTPASAVGSVNGALANIIMTNASNGVVLDSNNFTVEGVVITVAVGSLHNNTLVNISSTLTKDSSGLVDTNDVINNLTSGTKSYFALFPTILVITGIVLLITILVGLLFLVIAIFTKFSGKGKSSGGFAG